MGAQNEQRRGDSGARFLLMAASLIVVIAGLKAASSLILPFLMALFLALVSLPLLNWLVAKRVPKPLAVPITILMALAVLVAIVTLVGESISEFTQVAPKYKERLQVMSRALIDWIEAKGVDLPDRLAADLIHRHLGALGQRVEPDLLLLAQAPEPLHALIVGGGVQSGRQGVQVGGFRGLGDHGRLRGWRGAKTCDSPDPHGSATSDARDSRRSRRSGVVRGCEAGPRRSGGG